MNTNRLNFKALMLVFAVFLSSCNIDDSSILESPEGDDSSLLDAPEEDDNSTDPELFGEVSSINYYFYDDFRLVKTLTYSDSESTEPSNGKEYVYDDAGNLIKESFFHSWNSELFVQSYYEYEYLGNKKVKEKLFTCNVYPGGEFMFSHYVDYLYDGDLLVKTEKYSGLDGSFVSSDHYEYDERGNLVLDYSYDPSWIGKGVWGGVYETGILGYRKYVYDNQDRLITVLTTDGILDFYPCLLYTYDNEGMLIKTEYHEYDGLTRYEENVYCKTYKYLEIVLFFDKNGNQSNKLQYFYDDLGNNIKTVRNDNCLVSERIYNDGLLIEQISYSCYGNGFFEKSLIPETK